MRQEKPCGVGAGEGAANFTSYGDNVCRSWVESGYSAFLRTVKKADMTNSHRIVIFGNAGSGKSWLANRLAQQLQVAAIELDSLHWVPGGFNQKVTPDEAKIAVRNAAALDEWIIEGVFGWLAKEALSRTTSLVWLDIPKDECIANLRSRPIKSGEDEESRTALFQWCSEYRVRKNTNSYSGHLDIFENFTGEKHILRTRDEIEGFLSAFDHH
jgi:adenylate kinase family enzyme